MSTFTIKNPISVGETTEIKNDCVVPPTDYTLSDDQHAKVTSITESGSTTWTIKGIKAGTVGVTPVLGTCTDNTTKMIVINNDNEYFTEQGILDVAQSELVAVFIIGILVFIRALGNR